MKNQKKLENHNFKKEEIKILRLHLLNLTDNIIVGKVCPIDDLLKSFDSCKKKNQKILLEYAKSKDWALTIKLLLDQCIVFGTIPFSILARYAFISNSLLRSLVSRNALSTERLNEFLNSIDTVASELVIDLDKYFYGELTKSNFIKKYGHLRPGTYDITSKTYSENFDSYFNQRPKSKKEKNELAQEEFVLTKIERTKITELINECEFSFNVDELLEFSKKAISMREFGKFEFTKTISSVFNIIIDFGKENGLNRDELSFLSIHDFINISENVGSGNLKSVLKKEIQKNSKIYSRNKLIHLPNIIRLSDDINYIKIPKARPNFVTQSKVSGGTAFVDNYETDIDLANKIVLIEGADPGYDWIFTHNIIGLITKYGGSASHMTIRANEFNLPAAIGCGENLFSKIVKSDQIELNCAEKYINVY